MKKRIIEYMKTAEPFEACGFLLENGKFVAIENIAEDKTNSFEIDPLDWMGLDVKALIHSHPDGNPYLSTADREHQIDTEIDWWIVANDEIYKYRPVPLLRGRKFKYGHSDCYTLMRDAYHLAGIDLPDFPRSTIEGDKDSKMFLNNLGKIGFNTVDREQAIEEGDVLLLDYGYGASHVAVYIGNNQAIHHEIGRLSRRDQFDEYMQQRIHSVWRHKDWNRGRIMGILNDLGVAI